MAWEGPPAPYRIETERLVIRCYDPRDAAPMKDAIDSSLDHLREFMPWTDAEPQTLEEKVELCRRFRAAFDCGDNFAYGVFAADEQRQLAGAGLHPRIGPGGLEIGYFVRADAVRQGIATEVAAALTRVGFGVCEADRIEIRIDPRNTASFGIPRRLGFREEARLRRRLSGRPGEPLRDVVVHTLFHDEYDASTAPSLRRPRRARPLTVHWLARTRPVTVTGHVSEGQVARAGEAWISGSVNGASGTPEPPPAHGSSGHVR